MANLIGVGQDHDMNPFSSLAPEIVTLIVELCGSGDLVQLGWVPKCLDDTCSRILYHVDLSISSISEGAVGILELKQKLFVQTISNASVFTSTGKPVRDRPSLRDGPKGMDLGL